MQRTTRSLSGHGTIVSVGERTFPVFYMLSEIGERPMIGTLDLLDESMPFLAGTWLFESTVSHQLRLENGERFTFAIRTYDRTGRLEIESVGDRDMESIETGDHEDVGLSDSSLDPRGLDVPWPEGKAPDGRLPVWMTNETAAPHTEPEGNRYDHNRRVLRSSVQRRREQCGNDG